MMDIDRFYEILEIITRRYESQLERNDEQITFYFNGHTYIEDTSNIERIIDNMAAMDKSDNAIYNDTTYEIALDRRIDIIRIVDRDDWGIIEDCENHINYKIDNDGQEDEQKSLLEFLRRNMRSLITLKIQCASKKTKIQFEQFLIHLDFNWLIVSMK